MTVHTKLSAKGQIVIPKDVRERLGWPQGSALELVETSEGVLLRLPRKRGRSADEALARIRKAIRYDGPPIPIERLSWSAEVDEEFERSRRDRG
jgi:AbrB family looped-hinge helix DNA binding protein